MTDDASSLASALAAPLGRRGRTVRGGRRAAAHAGGGVQAALLWGAAALLIVFVVAPLSLLLTRSLSDEEGRWVGASNFVRHLGSARSAAALANSVLIAAGSTTAATASAFVYAYALTHARIPLRRAFTGIALLPLYAPTTLLALGLVYLLGNQGLLTTGAFGNLPGSASVDVKLYGAKGVVLADALAVFPAAFLLLKVSLSSVDGRLYEAAVVTGASPWRTFLTVTLPACRFGLCSALAVGFAMSVTDFGAPKILAGQTRVLAVDVYQQVVGQQNLSMGAAVSLVLLAVAVAAFAIDRLMRRRQQAALVSGRAVAHVPAPSRVRDVACFAFCTTVAGCVMAPLGSAVFASVVDLWPYSLTRQDLRPGDAMSLKHLRLAAAGDPSGGGSQAYLNSLTVALWTAVVGAAFTFGTAYLVEKSRRTPSSLRRVTYGLAVVPSGVPGLALGLALAVLVGRRSWGPVPNPLSCLYGTTAILVACNVVHFLGFGFLTAVAALRRLDAEFEQAAETLAVPVRRLFLQVTLPLCFPAVAEIALYYFVGAMTTLSAVVFLYTPDTPLASVAVVNLDDAGQTQAATALCVLILMTNVAARGVVGIIRNVWRRFTATPP